MSSYCSFEGDSDDDFERGDIVSGIKDGKRYGPEGEVLGSTYGSGERIILGESGLGITLGKKLGA